MNVSQMMMHEWKAIFHDKRLLAVLFMIPVSYMLLFGSMYSQGQVENLATVYIDQNNTALSQQIVQAFDTSSSFHLLGAVSSEAELIDYIESGQAAVGLIIPNDLSTKMKQNKHAEILTMIDGSNMMIANVATRNANEIIQTFSTSISLKRLEAKGMEADNALSIQHGYRIFYNPGFNYSIFLLIGLFGAVIQQVIFLGISLAVTREKEAERWPAYIAGWKQPWNIIYAKCTPYFLIGFFNIFLTYGVLSRFFHIPLLGSMRHFLILSTAFILCLLGIGFFASLTAKTQLQATQVTMLIALPSFLLSGFTWPFDAMPGWIAYIGHALPLTYFLHGLREVAIKGNGWEQISMDITVLLLMSVLFLLLSMLVLVIEGKKQEQYQSE